MAFYMCSSLLTRGRPLRLNKKKKQLCQRCKSSKAIQNVLIILTGVEVQAIEIDFHRIVEYSNSLKVSKLRWIGNI